MFQLSHALPLALVFAASPALAQDDDKPPEPVVLKHVPPRFSWDFGVKTSYSMLPQFDAAPAWLGLGFRASWGRHYSEGRHRIGFAMDVSLEGPIAVQWGNYFEPQFAWDFVSDRKVWVGASIGPSLVVNADLQGETNYVTTVDVAPMVSFRVGFSQPYSLVAKRFFFGIQPYARVIDGKVGAGGALVLGTGMGY